jgi:hypothetical protein
MKKIRYGNVQCIFGGNKNEKLVTIVKEGAFFGRCPFS